jgi:hypothetical protein
MPSQGENDPSGFGAGEVTVKIPPSISLCHFDFYTAGPRTPIWRPVGLRGLRRGEQARPRLHHPARAGQGQMRARPDPRSGQGAAPDTGFGTTCGEALGVHPVCSRVRVRAANPVGLGEGDFIAQRHSPGHCGGRQRTQDRSADAQCYDTGSAVLLHGNGRITTSIPLFLVPSRTLASASEWVRRAKAARTGRCIPMIVRAPTGNPGRPGALGILGILDLFP